MLGQLTCPARRPNPSNPPTCIKQPGHTGPHLFARYLSVNHPRVFGTGAPRLEQPPDPPAISRSPQPRHGSRA